MPVSTKKQCEGYTLSGQQCKRKVAAGHRYCSTHCRAAEIGLPPFITVTPTDSFWIFLPIGRPKWRVGSSAGVTFRCLANNVEYSIEKYISEGTYGAVYFGTCEHGPNKGRQVAIKVCKEIYRNKRKEITENDFIKEYFMHSAVRDRVRANCVVRMVDAFFLKTEGGFHGCIAMECMDGNLQNLFKSFDRHPNSVEVLRFWIFSCNFIADALLQLHANNIFHLDIKPGNVLWRRVRGSEKGRGIYLRLVDLGLGCYLGKTGQEPRIICAATGTYIPVEWRENGDKSVPTFEEIDDPKKLQTGEAYALCVTCYKLLKHVAPGLYARNPRIAQLRELIGRGMQDEIRVRSTVSIKMIQQLSGEILDEMDAALPLDMDESLRQIIPSSHIRR